MASKPNSTKSAPKGSSNRKRLVVEQSTPAMKAKEMSEDDRLNDYHFEPFYYAGVLRCGAKSKRHGRKCYGLAMENGRCRVHGGKSTGPIGMKGGRVTVGEFESIALSSLTDEELYLYFDSQVDPLTQIDHEIRLITVREHRMLGRIEKLNQSEYSTVRIQTDVGIEKGFQTDIKQKVKESNVERIQRIEEALTRVQAQKSKLLELKHRIQSTKNPNGAGLLDELAEVIRQSAELLGNDPIGDEDE